MEDVAEDLMDEAEKSIGDKVEKDAKEVSRRSKDVLKSTNQGPSYG